MVRPGGPCSTPVVHAGRKIALLCIDPWREPQTFHPFNFAVRRVQAALLAAEVEGAEVHLVEARDADPEALAARLEALEPDVVGASAYVWSFACFVDVAERVKRRRPETTIVFGGPSARPAMFELEPYRDRRGVVDALALGEGEPLLPEIARLATRGPDALAQVPGLALPTSDGFRRTPEAALTQDLDALASPYRAGLVASTVSAHVETFRGCPLSCSFCQWGDSAGNSRVFSQAYLTEELRAIQALGLREALLVDAGLNLNIRAFRNLAAAEREVRVLRDVGLHFEVYPSQLTDEHLAFLSEIKLLTIGLGLQSYDKEVLRRMQRPFDEARFERVARDLASLGGDATIEIIMGLPGDGPETFLRTLERARSLPCNVRAYHCMVLPDALMTRAPSWADMRFDPSTLLMQSSAGWTERALRETGERLARLAEEAGGWSQGTFWFFPREGRQGFTGPSARAGAAAPADVDVRVVVLPRPALERVSGVVSAATAGAFRVTSVERREAVVSLSVDGAEGPLVLELERTPAAGAFRVVGDVAVRYRGAAALTPGQHAALSALCARGGALFARLVADDPPGRPVSLPLAPR